MLRLLTILLLATMFSWLLKEILVVMLVTLGSAWVVRASW